MNASLLACAVSPGLTRWPLLTVHHVGAITDRTEQFHDFAKFLMIGGRLIGHDDPDCKERW